MAPQAPAIHRQELARFYVFALSLIMLSGLPYAHPALADLRPWVSGEPVPLFGLWWPQDALRKVEETADGIAMVIVDPDPEESAIRLPTTFPDRTPAVHSPLIVPAGALDAWFHSLRRVEDERPGAAGVERLRLVRFGSACSS